MNLLWVWFGLVIAFCFIWGAVVPMRLRKKYWYLPWADWMERK